MLTKFITLTLFVFLLSAQAEVQHDFSFDLSSGYDSNPLRYNDDFKDGSFFHKYYLKSGHEYQLNEEETLSADFYIKYENYPDVNDANKFYSKAKFEWEKDWQEFTFAHGLEAAYYDKTYVSRLRGRKASFSGESTENRYDKYKIGYFTNNSYRLNTNFKLYLDASYYYVNYLNDYKSLGLRRLDHHEFKVEPKARIKFDKGFYLYLSPSYTRRNYIGRKAEDSSGNLIDGSKLHYDIFLYELKLRYHDFTLGAYFSKRKGNYSNYNDLDKQKYYLKYEYENDWGNVIFEAAYYKQEYAVERSSTFDDIEDSGKERDGFELSVRYERELFGGEIYLELSYNEEDDDLDIYDYERSLITIGYIYKF